MAPPVPEDIYKQDVDFTALALQYPSFSKKLKSNRQLDFTDPESVKQLTLSLLHRDFDLTIDLPDNRLCPPVPNRFNYIIFLQHLLSSTSPSFRDTYDPNRSVIGIDIGTGASAIYPLLGCRQYPRWKFLCTEIDDTSRQFAQSNIHRNNLDSRIKIVDTDPTSSQLIPSQTLQNFPQIDFLMTNPPFYSSATGMLQSAKLKSRPPNSACTGAPIEMIYPYPPPPAPTPSVTGGEVLFTTQLIHTSTHPSLRTRIQWYSTLLGKHSSLTPLITLLQTLNITNYAVTEFTQGQKTRRWCLAWSFQNYLPSMRLARGVVVGVWGLEKKLLPRPNEFVVYVVGTAMEWGGMVDGVLGRLRKEEEGWEKIDGGGDDESRGAEEGDEVDDGRLMWQWKPSLNTGLGMVKADCWSRKARRRRRRPRTAGGKGAGGGRDEEMKDANHNYDDEEGKEDKHSHSDSTSENQASEPALVFKIGVTQEPDPQEYSGKTTITVRWLQGNDSVLFESFCGWLKRKLEGR